MANMPTKRQTAFLSAVAEAARAARPVLPRGRPTPENLTAEGRRMGLASAHAAPRCQALRRDGKPCRAPALRGATRCVKHGGRVEVPEHPHNIRRFLQGKMHDAIRQYDDYREGKEAWERLSPRAQREAVATLPKQIVSNKVMLYRAARLLWLAQEGDITPMGFQRQWRALLRSAS